MILTKLAGRIGSIASWFLLAAVLHACQKSEQNGPSGLLDQVRTPGKEAQEATLKDEETSESRDESSAPAGIVEIAGAGALVLATSDEPFAFNQKESILHKILGFITPISFASETSRKLLKVVDDELTAVELFSSKNQRLSLVPSALKKIGDNFIAISFTNGQTVVVNKTSGSVLDVSNYVDAGLLYLIERFGYIFSGKPSSSVIYRIDPWNEPLLNRTGQSAPNL